MLHAAIEDFFCGCVLQLIGSVSVCSDNNFTTHVAQLSLKNLCDMLHHGKWQNPPLNLTDYITNGCMTFNGHNCNRNCKMCKFSCVQSHAAK